MKLKALLITALLYFCYSTCIGQTKRGYAVYTAEDKTITCYDDGNMSSRPGTYKLELIDNDNAGCGLNGFDDNIKKVVEKVKFDPSFVSAKFRSITRWFSSMSALTTIEGLQYFDTSEVTSARVVFNGCSSLETIDLSSLSMPKLQNANGMFLDCGAKTIKLFKSGNQITSTEMMFMECESLESLDLNNLNTSNVTTMENMFSDCPNLASIDLSSFDTGNVKNMALMFSGCEALTKLEVNYFDTHNVTQMNGMFIGCKSLINIGESNVNTNTFNYISFDTGNVTNMKSMFADCSSLARLDLSDFDTSNVTDMKSMFSGCSSLVSNFFKIVGFNTSKVTNMERMFYGCQSLTSLSLYTFDTSKVTNMSEMFKNCELLMTILVGDGWTVENVTQSSLMFDVCRNLKGSQGTAWAYNHLDASYAHVDGGESNPGYLTYRALKTYDLWLGNVQVTELNHNNIPVAAGKASYNSKSKLLTLNNVTINATGRYACVMNTDPDNNGQCIDDLILKVVGKCNLNSEGNAIFTSGNMVIMGTGQLVVDCAAQAFHIEGVKTLTFAVKRIKANAGSEVIAGHYSEQGHVVFDECFFEGQSKYSNILSTFVRLNSLTMTNCHFADPGGEWRYSETDKFFYNKNDGGRLLFDGTIYKGKVVIEPNTEPVKYRLWIGGTQVTSANKNNIGGLTSGTATFNPNSHTLTLNNAKIEVDGYDDGISNGLSNLEGMPDFKIVCNGTNSIDATASEGSGLALYGNTTISGSRLGISAYWYGIYLAELKELTFKDADVYTEATYTLDSYPIRCGYNSIVNVRHSRLEADPGSSQNSPVYAPIAFNMINCEFADPGNGINPKLLYYNNDAQMLGMYYGQDPYDGLLLIVPTEISIATGLEALQVTSDKSQVTSNEWYTIDGRKLSGKPTKKGIYIHNGRISLTN